MSRRSHLTNSRLPLDISSSWVRNTVLVMLLVAPFLPWTAFTNGKGQVTAINPNERVQPLTASVGGFVKVWYVKEGDRVKEGDIIAELVDNDPSYLDRLQREKNAATEGLASSRLMIETAKLDLDRQKNLFDQGLTSRKDLEKARIEFSKLNVEYSKNTAILTKSETQLSRQSTQRILAPRNGTVTRILPGERGLLIKAGSPIAVFSPDVTDPAVELWIDGNDASMLKPGQRTQLQFEGWPSIQIDGWPSIAIGTFSGKVHLVDQASSYAGKFRVLIVPNSVWPSQNILRLGVHAKGTVRLRDSFVLKEIWRQLNGFPPVLEPIKDELNKMLVDKSEPYKNTDKTRQ